MSDSPAPGSSPRLDGMPLLGYGTYQLTGRECVEGVKRALDLGYRHVDTAEMYGNEEAVGEGLDRSDIPREEVFVATKVWPDDLGYDDAIATARASAERLGVDSIDLLYVHWPSGNYDPEGTMAAFANLYDDGVIEHVGVSNFSPALVEEARAACDAPIFANQVEMHPLLPQEELVEYTRENDVALVAYAPIARGRVFDVPEISAVAEKHGATEAQVSLAWLRAKGVAAIPKARGEHVRENWASLGVELDEEDVARIDGLDREVRVVDSARGPW